MTVKRITLNEPGGYAWQITPDGPIPAIFEPELEAGRIIDVPAHNDPAQRHHITVETFAGPVYVPVGYYLLKTDKEQVLGMTPDGYADVWHEVSIN